MGRPFVTGVFVRAAGALIASARRLNPSKHLESRTGRLGKNKVQVASLNTRGFNGLGDSLGGCMGSQGNPSPGRHEGRATCASHTTWGGMYPMYCPLILLVQSPWRTTAATGKHAVPVPSLL